jgi:hypothetical protein
MGHTALTAQQLAFSQVIARAWADPYYQQQLVREPETTLRAAGIQLADGAEVSIHVSTSTSLHLVIPPPPQDITDEIDFRDIELSQVLLWSHT